MGTEGDLDITFGNILFGLGDIQPLAVIAGITARQSLSNDQSFFFGGDSLLKASLFLEKPADIGVSVGHTAAGPSIFRVGIGQSLSYCQCLAIVAQSSVNIALLA